MRFRLSSKSFLCVSAVALLLLFYMSLREYKNNSKKVLNAAPAEESVKKISINAGDAQNVEEQTKMKYILQWSSPKNVPFVYMGVGQSGFIERNCTYTNCFVTSDRNYFGDYTKFDVIAFHGPEIGRYHQLYDVPKRRSLHQKFVFASIESADNYPVCSKEVDNFFNWTWTYKLTSDARWGYIVVRDSNNKVIGPNVEMHWMKIEEMAPVSEEFKEKLKTKTKAAAWFVSNCRTRSGRKNFVMKLTESLKRYGLNIDVYGSCGTLKCPSGEQDKCTKLIEKDYYFYLSFENSFAEDYVTEKLLHPLQNNAVPIVYGDANYTRFMPDGIYLNARQLGPEKLAEKMNELILNPDLYADYFRWKNHYSYHSRHESVETDDYCRFCSMLNEEELVKKVTTYPNFRQWWNLPNRC